MDWIPGVSQLKSLVQGGDQAIKSGSSQTVGITKDIAKDGSVTYKQAPVCEQNQPAEKDSSDSSNTASRSQSREKRITSTTSSSQVTETNNRNTSNNNNNNDKNNNNIPRTSTTTEEVRSTRREEARRWFESLETTGIEVNFDHELDRLVTVRAQMRALENNCAGFLKAAVRFAKRMDAVATTVSKFCSYLKFFESVYIKERDAQLDNYEYELRTVSNKPNKKKWTSSRALEQIESNEGMVEQRYQQALSLVRENQMATTGPVLDNAQIRVDLPPDDLVNLVRTEASNNSVRFGSSESAVYHIVIHPVDPLHSYLHFANALIASVTSIVNSFKVNTSGNEATIDIESVDSQTGDSCVVLVKNGGIILKTYIPKHS